MDAPRARTTTHYQGQTFSETTGFGGRKMVFCGPQPFYDRCPTRPVIPQGNWRDRLHPESCGRRGVAGAAVRAA